MDSVVATPRVGLRTQTWTFARHFLEMCVAMCVGGGVLNFLLIEAGPARIGSEDPRQQFPELSLLLITALYCLPMVLWMRFRGMEWRPIVEMSGAAIGVALLAIGLAWIGFDPLKYLQGRQLAICLPACAAMFGAMLFRIDLYTGRTGHQMAHAQPTPDRRNSGDPF